MIALREIYKCVHCGSVVEVVKEAMPVPVCCAEKMQKLDAKAEDTGSEKHVPVVEEAECGIKVKVGDVEHPMLDEHYINFIEVLTESKVLRAELKPGQKPEACFCAKKEDVIEVREYCNLHGLWKA
ncbi:MAG: desulfoferrodoxin [Candidatus Zapsychrus exili]|nr:desulfoferrodoxin [Candidatus Zapsychrus exili]